MVSLLVFVAACGEPTSLDAGTARDAATVRDAGVAPMDAGGSDAGGPDAASVSDAGVDAGASSDAGAMDDASSPDASVPCGAAVVGAPVRVTHVTDSRDGISEYATATDGTTFAALWHRVRDQTLWFSRLDASGARVSADVEIARSFIASEHDLVWNGSEYGLTWLGERSDGSLSVMFETRRPDGSVSRPASDVSAHWSYVAGYDDAVQLAWAGSGSGWAVIVHRNLLSDTLVFQALGAGTAPLAPPRVIGNAGSSSSDLVGAQISGAPDGRYMVFEPIERYLRLAGDGTPDGAWRRIPELAIPTNLIHDGYTWAVAGSRGDDVQIIRGDTLAQSSTIFDSSAEGLWVWRTHTRARDGRFALAALVQRPSDRVYGVTLALAEGPMSVTGPVRPISMNLTIDFDSVSSDGRSEATAEWLGPDRLLTAWLRHAAGEQELYVAPVTLGACP